jgi:AcrR family transcriptional regulator
MAASNSAFARKREATCNAILEATGQLIAQKGVDGFTISEVALRAQINRALIYHYFKDRERLIQGAIQHIVDRYQPVGQETSDEAVERMVRMHIEHPEIARFFIQLLLDGRPLPSLGPHIRAAIDGLERYQRQRASVELFDPAFAMIMLTLTQLSWAFAREELARLLGIDVEEADQRFIAQLKRVVGLGLQAMTRPD